MKPPNAAPPVNPTPAYMIIVARIRFELYSPTSELAFDTIVPRPTPARKRIASSCGTVETRAVSSVMTPKNRAAPTMTGRRPIRSASMLHSSAPMSTPKFAAANTGPSAAFATPHSRMIDGAV